VSEQTLPSNALGRTGLPVTKLGYGAMEVRGSRIWGGRPIEDRDAETILNAVIDNGITFVDTANDYGRSEEYIGR
jgi:aryl-alcohol dehydrogenase-like predicted oxidoreductase